MKNRILGKNLEVSPIGLGCMGFSHAYGTATDEETAVKALQQAVEMGYSLMRNCLDRCYGPIGQGEFNGKSMYFIVQGASPEKRQLEGCEFTMSRFAGLYGFTYKGMVSNLNGDTMDPSSHLCPSSPFHFGRRKADVHWTSALRPDFG